MTASAGGSISGDPSFRSRTGESGEDQKEYMEPEWTRARRARESPASMGTDEGQ